MTRQSTSRTVRLLAHSVVAKDAIGRDVVEMAAVLDKAGYRTEIHAAGIDPCFARMVHPFDVKEARRWSANDIVIYHHSTSWPEAEQYIETTHAPVIVRYHNVTPPEFFAGISEPHYQASLAGQDATRRLARIPGALFWGASAFNCDELARLGAASERCRVLAPLHRTESFEEESFDYQLLNEWRGHETRILFVGGFKPNKRHERAIRIFSRYHAEVNPKSRLILAGSLSDAFAGYADSLRKLIARLGLQKSVWMVESASASTLRTLYTLADAFLCVSEHEGFCVPLIEAMFFRVPIVAWGTTAVGETVGSCGMVCDEIEEESFIESIAALADNTDLAHGFRMLGRDRFDSVYASGILQSRVVHLMNEAAEVLNGN